uniref:Uncharacterized protein n=1 Tax=Anguilla anguilla TaxID=7936 RepID=A0A0E9P7K7_ANGAN
MFNNTLAYISFWQRMARMRRVNGNVSVCFTKPDFLFGSFGMNGI